MLISYRPPSKYIGCNSMCHITPPSPDPYGALKQHRRRGRHYTLSGQPLHPVRGPHISRFKESEPHIFALEEGSIERFGVQTSAGLCDGPEIAGVGRGSGCNEGCTQTIAVALVRDEPLAACSSSGLTGAVEHKVRRSFPLEIKDVIGSEHSIGKADGARLRGGWIERAPMPPEK